MTLWTFGDTTNESAVSSAVSTNYLVLSQQYLATPAKVITCHAYLSHNGGTGASQPMRFVLYKNEGGYTGSLAGVSAEWTLNYTGFSSWYSANVESTLNTEIEAGYYFIGLWGGTSTAGIGIAKGASSGGYGWYNKALTYHSTNDPSSTITSIGTQNASYNMAFYCTVCDPHTFGYNDVLTLYSATTYRRGMQHTLLEDATVNSIWMYSYMPSGTCYVKAGIYEDVTNSPEDRLGVTEELAISDATPTWRELTFPTPVSLSAGTYWIGWENSATFYMYRRVSGGNAKYANQTTTYSSANSPITPFNPATVVDGYNYSIYAEYTTQLDATVVVPSSMSASSASLKAPSVAATLGPPTIDATMDYDHIDINIDF